MNDCVYLGDRKTCLVHGPSSVSGNLSAGSGIQDVRTLHSALYSSSIIENVSATL